MFNALGIISYDPVRRVYAMRYTATVRGDEWHEIGEGVVGSGAPVRTFEMRLRRVGSTDWPQAAPVPPR